MNGRCNRYMAYRELKNRTRISSTLDNDVYKVLKDISRNTDVPVTKILDKAIMMYAKSIGYNNK